MFPNKLAPKVFNNIPKNPPFYSFVSFSIVLVISFNKIYYNLEALEQFSKCCSFLHLKLLRLLFQNQAAAVIPNGVKIFFANGTATFINEPVNLLKNEHKNPPD